MPVLDAFRLSPGRYTRLTAPVFEPRIKGEGLRTFGEKHVALGLAGSCAAMVLCQLTDKQGLRTRSETAEAHITLPAELLKVSVEAPDSTAIRYAAELIKRGQVVGVPTDTFYGLAADPFNLAAVEEIYRVKGRPENRALPILVNSIEQVAILSRDLPLNFLKLAQKFWPGALTIVVEASQRLPLKVTANKGRVALRWPNSRVVSAIIEQVGSPITGTSANISGFPSCSNAQELVKQLGKRLPLILDSGETGATLSSTIVNLNGEEWSIVREGQVSGEEIDKVLAEA